MRKDSVVVPVDNKSGDASSPKRSVSAPPLGTVMRSRPIPIPGSGAGRSLPPERPRAASDGEGAGGMLGVGYGTMMRKQKISSAWAKRRERQQKKPSLLERDAVASAVSTVLPRLDFTAITPEELTPGEGVVKRSGLSELFRPLARSSTQGGGTQQARGTDSPVLFVSASNRHVRQTVPDKAETADSVSMFARPH